MCVLFLSATPYLPDFVSPLRRSESRQNHCNAPEGEFLCFHTAHHFHVAMCFIYIVCHLWLVAPLWDWPWGLLFCSTNQVVPEHPETHLLEGTNGQGHLRCHSSCLGCIFSLHDCKFVSVPFSCLFFPELCIHAFPCFLRICYVLHWIVLIEVYICCYSSCLDWCYWVL